MGPDFRIVYPGGFFGTSDASFFRLLSGGVNRFSLVDHNLDHLNRLGNLELLNSFCERGN